MLFLYCLVQKGKALLHRIIYLVFRLYTKLRNLHRSLCSITPDFYLFLSNLVGEFCGLFCRLLVASKSLFGVDLSTDKTAKEVHNLCDTFGNRAERISNFADNGDDKVADRRHRLAKQGEYRL